jgi:phage-related protein
MALQRGFNLGMPLSRPMPVVGPGVEELRLRDESGHNRLFLAKRRLKEMLNAHEEVGGRS